MQNSRSLRSVNIKFIISEKYIDKVKVDEVPFDVCGVVFSVHEGCDLHGESKPLPLDQGWEVLHHQWAQR
jgi:hypothetical protein